MSEPPVPDDDADGLRRSAEAAAAARWPQARLGPLRRLPGGVSSMTYAATLTVPGEVARPVVVKVAPPGLAPVQNRDVLRQARVMRALTGADGVEVPEVLVERDGEPPFFIMDFVAGDAYEPRTDVADDPPDPATVDARARAAARMLAQLQTVEPEAIGLGGEPVLSPAQELERWARLFATAPPELHHGQAHLRDRLLAAVPEATPPRVLHGDYRLGNMQFAGERLAAIIDWEIWSVGDPRSDLAWLLVLTDPVQCFHEQRDAANERAAAAMPAASELLREYLDVRPVALDELAWFEAASRYKMASTTAALVKHNRRRARPDPRITVAATALPAMLARASACLDARGG